MTQEKITLSQLESFLFKAESGRHEMLIDVNICVAPKQRAGEDGNVVGGRSQCTQSIALGRISTFQLVNFIGYGVIEEPVTHVAADEVDRCKAANLPPICLP